MAWSEEHMIAGFQKGMRHEPGPDCPAPEQLWDAVGGLLPPAKREKLIRHMSACPHCAFVWQAAREMQPHDQQVAQTSPDSGAVPWWKNLLRPVVLAPLAGAAAAALVALVWMSPGQLPDLPTPQASGVMRGLPNADIQLSTGASVMTPGQALTWAPVGGALAHRLVLFSDAGARVEILPEQSDRWPLADELAQSFEPGEQVYWFVEAIDGDRPGARSATATFQFLVEPPDGG